MRYLLFVIFIFSCELADAQVKALTETGDEVVLFHDGTWKYLNDSVFESKEISVNEFLFYKNKNSTFLVKSKNLNIGVWINPKEWKFERGGEDDSAEFIFTRKGKDLYAMLISEKVEIPLEMLKDIALDNARSVAPDIRIKKEEYRNINGIDVLMLQMYGTLQGMKVSYFGYYYSSVNGTIQLLGYTTTNLFDEYFNDIETLLNGFDIFQ
jgi:hypothetical protein